jgi:TfoX/Sxy family transcriptional regulator of competence genes
MSNAVDLYDKLIAAFPDITRKGATMPYTSINGNMFTFLDKDGNLNLRLPEEKLQEFIKKFKAKQSVQHGIVMKEYVSVPEQLLAATKDLKPWVKSSYEYAKTLKPKKTKK